MIKSKILIALLLSTMHLSITAGEVDIPNTFSAGTPAVAAEVNGNFSAVETAVDGNAVDIAAVLATVTAMEARLATLEADVVSLQTDNTALVADNTLLQNFITEVVPYLQGGADAQGNPAVFFSGLNVHVNNGEGATSTADGTGNLIVGYDERLAAGSDFCTITDINGNAYLVQADCEDNSGIWGTDSQKIGSHNLIIGTGHNYTQYGGLISGVQNTVTARYSSISGGAESFAQAFASSISGGRLNNAEGIYSSVSGGEYNDAIGEYASVSGGQFGDAEGNYSSISGGSANNAIGIYSSVSAGRINTAIGVYGSISGGYNNVANGDRSSVSGGSNGTASGADDWVAGTLFEDN